jgi:hypothetical protein
VRTNPTGQDEKERIGVGWRKTSALQISMSFTLFWLLEAILAINSVLRIIGL